MNEMVKAMVAAGYVVSPNNIYGLPGVLMYAGGPGIREFGDMLEVQVLSDRIRVFKSKLAGEAYGRCSYLDTITVAVFDSVAAFLAAADKISEPGLPAYAQGWD